MIRTFEILAVVLLLAVFSGCGQPAAPPAAVPQTNVGEHHHSGWWCAEHGVPEEICARCSSTVAADFQKKGDWCKEHDRPESQCFICHPELQAKFAADYEAKEGKQPPKPTE